MMVGHTVMVEGRMGRIVEDRWPYVRVAFPDGSSCLYNSGFYLMSEVGDAEAEEERGQRDGPAAPGPDRGD